MHGGQPISADIGGINKTSPHMIPIQPHKQQSPAEFPQPNKDQRAVENNTSTSHETSGPTHHKRQSTLFKLCEYSSTGESDSSSSSRDSMILPTPSPPPLPPSLPPLPPLLPTLPPMKGVTGVKFLETSPPPPPPPIPVADMVRDVNIVKAPETIQRVAFKDNPQFKNNQVNQPIAVGSTKLNQSDLEDRYQLQNNFKNQSNAVVDSSTKGKSKSGGAVKNNDSDSDHYYSAPDDQDIETRSHSSQSELVLSENSPNLSDNNHQESVNSGYSADDQLYEENTDRNITSITNIQAINSVQPPTHLIDKRYNASTRMQGMATVQHASSDMLFAPVKLQLGQIPSVGAKPLPLVSANKVAPKPLRRKQQSQHVSSKSPNIQHVLSPTASPVTTFGDQSQGARQANVIQTTDRYGANQSGISHTASPPQLVTTKPQPSAATSTAGVKINQSSSLNAGVKAQSSPLNAGMVNQSSPLNAGLMERVGGNKLVRFSGDVPNNSDNDSVVNSKLVLRRPTGTLIFFLLVNSICGFEPL